MKRVSLLAALALAGLVAGCGSEPSAPPNPAAPSPTESYTMEQVAQHGNADSCWTVIDGGVYDVTRWIGQHPGGEDRIKNLCGKDGTQDFTGQHDGDVAPTERLSSFRIGTLSG